MKHILLFLLAVIFLPLSSLAQGCSDAGDDEGVKIIGYIQPQYEYQILGDSVQKFMNNLKSNNGFYFNRARMGVTGNIPYDFGYYFLAEFSPSHGGPYVLDAFVSYKRWAPYLKIAMGQFKQPFGLELQTPCHDLYTVDRSRVVNELASPFRDFGVMLLGSSGDKKLFGLDNENIFSWMLSITNGTGQNIMDDNSAKDLTGRLVFSPVEGLGIGGSFKYGKQASVVSNQPDDTRMRWGADLSFKRDNIILQGEYIYGNDHGSSLVGGGCGSTPVLVLGDFIKNGYWAAFQYKFNQLSPIIKYQNYYYIGHKTNGDLIAEQTQQEFIAGFNYYFNDWTRLQMNYVYTLDSNLPDDPAYLKNYIIVQIQAKFN